MLFVLAQIIISVALIGLILLQAKGMGLGNSAIFGGSGQFYSSKRGVEKIVFNATVALAVLFGVVSVLLLVLK